MSSTHNKKPSKQKRRILKMAKRGRKSARAAHVQALTQAARASKEARNGRRNFRAERELVKASVDAYLDEFDTLSPEEQERLLADLAAHSPPKHTDFVCTILNAPIVTPCECDTCGFYTRSPEAPLRCLQHLRFQQGLDSFSVEQLSVITDIPSSRIKASVDAAFNTIRKHNIAVEISTGNYNKFTYRGGVPVCVVCSAPTPKKPFVVDSESDLRYCSRPCYKKRPPSLIRLEIEFGVDIRVVLAVARKVLKRLPLIASALDVKRRLLLHWYDEFLGLNASVFGSDAVDVVDVMRRSHPKHSWALDFLKNPHSRMQAITPQKFAILEQECTKLCKSL